MNGRFWRLGAIGGALVALVLVVTPVAAQEGGIELAPLDEGTPEHELASSVAEWLRLMDNPRGTLQLSGPVTARKDGDQVRVVVPGVRFQMHEETLAWGDLTFNAHRTGPNLFDFDLEAPKKLRVVQGEQVKGTISAGSYELGGVWHTEVHAPIAINGGWRDVRAKPQAKRENAATLRIGSVTMDGAMREEGGELWSGGYNFHLESLEAKSPDGAEGLTIGSISLESETSAMPLREYMAGMREVQFPAPVEGAEEPPPEQVVEELRALRGMLNTYFSAQGDSIGTLTVRDIAVWAAGEQAFAADRITVDGGFRSDDANRQAIDIGFRAGRMAYMAEMGVVTEVAPGEVGVSFSFESLPLLEMIELALQEAERSVEAQQTGATPEDEEMAALETQARFMELVMRAQPRFVLKQAAFDAPALGVDGEGDLVADPQAQSAAVGSFHFEIARLDRAMQIAQQAAQEGREEAQNLVPVLMLIRGMGNPVPAKDGSGTVYVFDVEIPKQGSPSINGMPLDALMGGAMQPAPEGQEQ